MSAQELKTQHKRPLNKKERRARGREKSLLDGKNAVVPGKLASTVLSAGFSIARRPVFNYAHRCVVNYYTAVTFTSGAASAGAYVFSANGLFDPDITSTGGQPMGFDQMMLFFNHYTVRYSKIRVVFGSNSTALRATVALMVSGTSTATTVIENAMENGDITFQVLEFAGAFGGSATLERKLDVGRFQAVTDVMDDPNMRGDASANPAEQAYYHLMCWCADSVSTVSVGAQVFLEYDVTFHEPRKGPLS